MERSVFRYILRHSWRDQVLLLVVTAVGFPLIYITLEIPKRIVNSAIGGKDVPSTFLGFEVTQISYLFALSVLLLTLITVNGAIKYWLNVYRGVVGERTMRRLRYELYQKVLLFPLPQFKTMSAGEIIPMIVSETEPIGSFVGESFNLPVLQGGLLLTYLVFIFNQNPWLGLAAVALYPPQVYLIPRLQRKINALAKDRVQTARALSDRIGESVAGAAEIRSNHTFYLEGADISDRLGTIYGIRVDIYKRKFFVKFLNNFLAQVTPFFFYSVGGFFVIKGELSLGALVAVLGAYKDILNPWKELLAWYSTKEDVRIKYEQIVSQFEPPGLIDSRLIAEAPPVIPRLAGEVAALALTHSEDGVTNRVDRVSFRIASGEHVALVGSHSGKDDLAFLLARLLMPSSGRIVVAGANFAEVHQAVPGRRVGYATQNAHVFSGTLAHNLYYGLKQQPVRSAVYDEHESIVQKKRVHDALAAGNIPYDVHADWIDYEAAGVADSSQLIEAALAALPRRNEPGGRSIWPREHRQPAGQSGICRHGAAGTGADSRTGAARGPGAVHRTIRSECVPCEQQHRRELAVRRATAAGVPTGESCHQPRDREAAARRRAAGVPLLGGRQSGRHDRRAVCQRPSRQPDFRAVQPYQRR